MVPVGARELVARGRSRTELKIWVSELWNVSSSCSPTGMSVSCWSRRWNTRSRWMGRTAWIASLRGRCT